MHRRVDLQEAYRYAFFQFVQEITQFSLAQTTK